MNLRGLVAHHQLDGRRHRAPRAGHVLAVIPQGHLHDVESMAVDVDRVPRSQRHVLGPETPQLEPATAGPHVRRCLGVEAAFERGSRLGKQRTHPAKDALLLTTEPYCRDAVGQRDVHDLELDPGGERDAHPGHQLDGGQRLTVDREAPPQRQELQGCAAQADHGVGFGDARVGQRERRRFEPTHQIAVAELYRLADLTQLCPDRRKGAHGADSTALPACRTEIPARWPRWVLGAFLATGGGRRRGLPGAAGHQQSVVHGRLPG